MFKNSSNISQEMNEYGKAKIPFLFVLDFLLEKPLIYPLSEVSNKAILFNINGFTNFSDEKKENLTEIIWQKKPIAFAEYAKAFQIVQKNLHLGNSYLLNLSAPTEIEINADLETIFYQSEAKYKLCLPNQMLCFSPEIFVQIQNRQIASFPMKGTIDASLPQAEKTILADKKEFAEHNTIVDLIRNDLSQVADNVSVEQFRYLDKIYAQDKVLLQVSSKIVGEMRADYPQNLGDLILKLLPAGSISGAPKQKTLEIIQEAESSFTIAGKPYERGYYTGIFGYFDGENLDSGVMIRYIEQVGEKLFFKSGGGVTAMSEAHSEYEELIAKVYLPIKNINY